MSSRKKIKISAYNSGIVQKIKQKQNQKKIAIFVFLFMLFQILSPFGNLLKIDKVYALNEDVTTYYEMDATGNPANFTKFSVINLSASAMTASWTFTSSSVNYIDVILTTNLDTVPAETTQTHTITDATASNYDESHTFSGLNANTDYYFKIIVKDASFNETFAIIGGGGIPQAVRYTDADTTAPTLTAGAASRISDMTGTVKFTSNESGQYYYTVVEDGAPADVVTTGTGEPNDTTEQTINLTGMIAGAKDVYIKVKDAVGNVSSALKIDLAAYVANVVVAPTYDPAGGDVSPSAVIAITSTTEGATIKATCAYDATPSDPDELTGVYDGTRAIGDCLAGNDSGTVNWKAVAIKDGMTQSEIVTASFNVLADEVTTYTLTPTADTGCHIDPNTVQIKAEGEIHAFTAGANSGYTFNGFSIDGGTPVMGTPLDADRYYLFDPIYANHTIRAKCSVTQSFDLTSSDKSHTKGGATVAFLSDSALPSNLSSGINVTVTDGNAHTVPSGKSIVKVYDISLSPTPTGTYLATITLNYPSGTSWKEGDTVMYWNGSAWASTGITVTSYTSSTITFTTNHFTEFAIMTNSLSNNGGNLPVTGSNIMNLIVNLLLASIFYFGITACIKRSRYSKVFD